jgi:hypothetical protein
MQRNRRKAQPAWRWEEHAAWLMAGAFWAAVVLGSGIVWLLK